MLEDRPRRYLILVPTPGEMEFLRSHLEASEPLPSGTGTEAVAGYLAKQPVVLVRTGPGKVLAARACQRAIDHFGPCRAVLLVGASGALAEGVRLGDVVVAERVVAHDRLWITNAGVIPAGINTFDAEGNRFQVGSLACSPVLLRLARAVAADLSLPPLQHDDARPSIHFGPIATGDQFIATRERKQWICETFGALVCAQEGEGAAAVAVLEGVPFLEMRGVSDLADEETDIHPGLLNPHPDQDHVQTGEVPPRPAIGERLRARLNAAAANAGMVVLAMLQRAGAEA